MTGDSDFAYTLDQHSQREQTMSESDGDKLLRDMGFPGIFESDPEITTEARDEMRALKDHYYKIEIDHSLSDQEKIPYMVEWWTKVHNTMIQCGLHRKALEKTVNSCDMVLRDNVDELFSIAHTHNVPVLVFSAGIGDVIQLLLMRLGLDYKNVRVVSNFMKFNSQDVLHDFSDPIIHTFNKTLQTVNCKYYNDKSKHSGIILLGDSTFDVNMANGAESIDVILRIGFLNDNIESKLEYYKSIYDIVLTNDSTFNVPMQIIKAILPKLSA